MTSITLKPITITYSQTRKFSVEEYLEWCQDTDNTPTKNGYRRYVIDYFIEELMDDVCEDNMSFKFGKEKEYEYEENESGEIEIPFDYSQYVNDLTEEELEEFHKLCESDKMNINPIYTKGDIIIMNSVDNPSMDYGVKLDSETKEILHIKKSIHTYHLSQYLMTL